MGSLTHFCSWVTHFFIQWHKTAVEWHKNPIQWHKKIAKWNIFLTFPWFFHSVLCTLAQKPIWVTHFRHMLTHFCGWVTQKCPPVAQIRSSVTHRKSQNGLQLEKGAFWCIFDDFLLKVTHRPTLTYILFYAKPREGAVLNIMKNKKMLYRWYLYML